MTLTEQWKKGELPDGFYYVKCDWSDEVEIRYVHNSVDDLKEIVAEVLSYDEWKQLIKEYERIVTRYNMKPIDYEVACEMVNKLLDEKKAFKEENTKLKKLLKECRYNVETDLEDATMCESNVDTEYFGYLLTRIDNAIGERE